MNHELLTQCLNDAFTGKMTFGETIGQMLKDGVEWYSADLLQHTKTYYAADGTVLQNTIPDWGVREIAPVFSESGIVAAIRASQRGEIIYPEFLRRACAAGVVNYTVHLHGRKAIYLGRHGDLYVEPFPQ